MDSDIKMKSNNNTSNCGKILHINLSDSTTSVEQIPKEIYKLLLGGKGLGIYLLYRIPNGCDPLSPENDLIYMTGPLTGTLAPCANKFGIVTKGPATNCFLDSYSSGKFGTNIKFAGFDAIIIHGKATELTTISISNAEVKFLKASDYAIKGLSPLETEIKLKEKFGSDYAVASIGLAGEKLSPISSIFTEQRCAGRGGAGAVMGSKNLKALMVKGTNPVKVNNPEVFRQAAWTARRYLRSGEITVRAMPQRGTANIVEIVNEMHAFPTKNFQEGYFDGADDIDGRNWQKEYWSKENEKGKRFGNTACYTCPISCSKVAYLQEQPDPNNFPESIKELNNEIVIDGPEYETVFSLGSNIGNNNREALITANYLCDYYGIDTISTGVIIGYIMELYERGIITESDLDGIKPVWGDDQVIMSLIRKIGTLEGCGKVIGLGVKKISEKWIEGKGSAMHVKGLEFPGYDPRRARGMGLCYAVSDRGACHLHAFTASVEVMGNAGGADPYDLGPKKIDLFLDMQAESTFIDSAILCFFTLNGMQIKEVVSLLRGAVDEKMCEEKNAVKLYAARILSLTRLFNYREGLTAADDDLPQRILKDTHKIGPAKGLTFGDWNVVLKSYYLAMGWDENGKPTMKTLKELGIGELYSKINKID